MTLSLDTNLKIEAATVPLVATVAEPEPLFRLARAPKPLAETLAEPFLPSRRLRLGLRLRPSLGGGGLFFRRRIV